jgi:predicted RNA-binding protein YlqC (UPF0109 family)
MKPFVEYVVKALVDHPEEVSVSEIETERAVIFELRLNQTDIGKVIGKSGRTINAIRSLLMSAAAKHGKRVMVEIIEPPGRGRAAADYAPVPVEEPAPPPEGNGGDGNGGPDNPAAPSQ